MAMSSPSRCPSLPPPPSQGTDAPLLRMSRNYNSLETKSLMSPLIPNIQSSCWAKGADGITPDQDSLGWSEVPGLPQLFL